MPDKFIVDNSPVMLMNFRFNNVIVFFLKKVCLGSLQITIRDKDIRSLGNKALGSGKTDAAGTAGDKSDFSF